MSDKVILIDDEQDVLETMKILLEDEGISVEIFSDIEKGIAAIQFFQPRAVVLDYSMPQMNGAEVLEKLSELNLFTLTDIYLCSGEDFSHGQIKEFKEMGFKDCIKKPFLNDLIDLLNA